MTLNTKCFQSTFGTSISGLLKEGPEPTTVSCGYVAMTPEAIKYVAVIYKPTLFVAVTPEAIKYVAVIYKPSLFVAVTPEAIKNVALIYKPSLFVAVTPEAIKYVAVIYKPSLTCRHLQADHSGTQTHDNLFTGKPSCDVQTQWLEPEWLICLFTKHK